MPAAAPSVLSMSLRFMSGLLGCDHRADRLPGGTENGRPAEADALLSLANETRAFGGLDEARESDFGDVHPGLDEEQAAFGLQGGPDLGEQPPGVGDLVGHPEGQGEIGPDVEPEPVLVGQVEPDPAGDAGADGPLSGSLEHARVDIHGHDRARLSRHPGHGDGEIARPAADVENDVARTDEAAEDAVRVLGHPPEDVRQGEGQPGRANMFGHGRQILRSLG